MSEMASAPISPAIVHAIEDNFFTFITTLRPWPHLEIHDDETLLWTLSHLPFPLFNVALRAQLAPEQADAAIEQAIERCRMRQVPLLWWTGPKTRPTDLGARLEQHGFRYQGTAPGMALNLDQLIEPALPENLRIEPVRTRDMLEEWAAVQGAGFGFPQFVCDAFVDCFSALSLTAEHPMQHYLGFQGDEPVAGCSLMLGGGAAGLYNVTTIPAARRQGFGTALTIAALRHARSLGYHLAILYASADGAPIYRRLGFQEYCRIGHYVWSA